MPDEIIINENYDDRHFYVQLPSGVVFEKNYGEKNFAEIFGYPYIDFLWLGDDVEVDDEYKEEYHGNTGDHDIDIEISGVYEKAEHDGNKSHVSIDGEVILHRKRKFEFKLDIIDEPDKNLPDVLYNGNAENKRICRYDLKIGDYKESCSKEQLTIEAGNTVYVKSCKLENNIKKIDDDLLMDLSDILISKFPTRYMFDLKGRYNFFVKESVKERSFPQKQSLEKFIFNEDSRDVVRIMEVFVESRGSKIIKKTIF
ncbi:MAG: hypothetical protein J7L45_00620 [Candidatus Aenigmarchaeota archaeon]|nr:hypothetical protein [Candidatus Aenigmarchaeota archaeon]